MKNEQRINLTPDDIGRQFKTSTGVTVTVDSQDTDWKNYYVITELPTRWIVTDDGACPAPSIGYLVERLPQADLTWDELGEELTGLGWTEGPNKTTYPSLNFGSDAIDICLYKDLDLTFVTNNGELWIETTSLRHARAIALAITQGDK